MKHSEYVKNLWDHVITHHLLPLTPLKEGRNSTLYFENWELKRTEK